MENKIEYRTEAFREFVEQKRTDLNDLVCLVDDAADKAEFLKEFFLLCACNEDFEFKGAVRRGISYIMGEITQDIRMISAEIMADADAVPTIKEAGK